MLPDEIKPALQGVIPSAIITASSQGVPNATFLSQVYYVDESHVALTHQFFNKTHRNIRENPYAMVFVTNPGTLHTWRVDLEFDHSETEGAMFDALDMQIEAIASMTGMSGVFKLQAADVYRVSSVRKMSLRTSTE